MDYAAVSETNRALDIAVGHHPTHGLCAAISRQLPAAAWILNRLDFRPVPGHPTLLALADQDRDGPARATQAAALLRRAGYHVDADLDISPADEGRPTAVAPRSLPDEPEVAFAEHPRLGVVAAISEDALRTQQILARHGWQHERRLDIYTLDTTDRSTALDRLVDTTVALVCADVIVAVQPHLAHAATTRGQPASPAPRTERPAGRPLPDGAAAPAAVSTRTSPSRTR